MYEYKAKVTNVVDGDTIDCVVDVGFDVTAKVRVRLNGIDTPELTGSEKEKGRVAKAYVESRILDKEITLQTYAKDSFGRWLGKVLLDEGDREVNIGDELIFRGLAVPYSTSRRNHDG